MIKVIFLGFSLVVMSCAVFASPVNINVAGADQIAKALKGVGPGKAAAIVAFRAENGPFITLKDLSKVKGIGKKTLDNNKDDIILAIDTE